MDRAAVMSFETDVDAWYIFIDNATCVLERRVCCCHFAYVNLGLAFDFSTTHFQSILFAQPCFVFCFSIFTR